MSREAVAILTELEEKLRRQRLDAAAAARETAAAAKVQGDQLIAEAVKRAEAELGALREQTENRAKAAAKEKAAALESRKAALREKAAARSAAAVDLIVERIVNG